MAIEFCTRHDTKCVLTLDAFFPSAKVFKLANSAYSIRFRQPMVSLIIRAKKNYVAFFRPERSKKKKKGRPRKYGMKVVLAECFDHMENFSNERCMIYGKMEDILISTHNLLWRPTGNMIRFVFASTSRGKIVLMCSDLAMDPLIALQLYCARTRIEITFDMLKNLIGAFNYRFWSKSLPLHSRKPKKNDKLKAPSSNNTESVERCWKAIEGFVMMGAIALGLLQLISIKFNKTVWKYYDAFLRTRSRELPSERTVKYVISGFLCNIFWKLASSGVIRKIQNRILTKNSAKMKNFS